MESGQAQCGALTAIKETTVKSRETDGRSLTDEADRTPPPLPSPQKPTNQRLDQGQRLLENIQQAGDKTAMTITAEL